MFKAILIICLVGYILYKIFPFLLRLFIIKKVGNMQNQQQTRQNTNQSAAPNQNKQFSNQEGEYVSYEEVKDEDTKKS